MNQKERNTWKLSILWPLNEGNISYIQRYYMLNEIGNLFDESILSPSPREAQTNDVKISKVCRTRIDQSIHEGPPNLRS